MWNQCSVKDSDTTWLYVLWMYQLASNQLEDHVTWSSLCMALEAHVSCPAQAVICIKQADHQHGLYLSSALLVFLVSRVEPRTRCPTDVLPSSCS
jgi:hypothetical protein